MLTVCDHPTGLSNTGTANGHLSEQLFSAIVDCFANFSSSVGSVSEEIYSLQAVYFSYTYMEVCGRCGGYVKVIACIEDQDIIDRILAHLRDKELATPSLPLLTPPSRAPPETLPLFAGKESSSTALNQQGSH